MLYFSHFKLVFQTKYAEVAQLVEQLICNQQVAGSSPIFGSWKSIVNS